jgi:UDP-2,4-diacetamido-2,4,6-trideoxy-beta-L-altropyranose hydrolase
LKIVFRADASLHIGTGHVMRCLTLAEFLKKKGAEVSFICREHAGNLISFIQEKGFNVHALAKVSRPADFKKNDSKLFHAEWLGTSQEQDAQACQPLLEKIHPDWVIVDHYALDQTWQACLKPTYKKLMVIDDLADRMHQCDLLLDQTFGRVKEEYQSLVPDYCQLLLGSEFALLRPEFAEWRAYSLQRRENPEFKNLLITMGGVDAENITGQVLEALNHCPLPNDLQIKVIMGSTAPHLQQVKEVASLMKNPTVVMLGVSNMAELMANADFAIGAAGATTWERCALGLPSTILILAENQNMIASIVKKAVLARVAKKHSLALLCKLPSKEELRILSVNSSRVCDGNGVKRTISYIL